MNKKDISHRISRQPLYKLWITIKTCCYNPNAANFKWYGGRGIQISEVWKNNFPNFKEWALTTGYQKGLSIDRIDVNGHYSPDNCRWITQSEQNKNQRSNVFLTLNGKTKKLIEFAKEYGIPSKIVYGRIRSCKTMSVERALTTPYTPKIKLK